MSAPWRLSLGANPEPGGVRFRIWAPEARSVDVILASDAGAPAFRLEQQENGYHGALIAAAGPSTRYRYRLDGQLLVPDPASRSQPDGVHGASEVIDPDAFEWADADRRGLAMDGLVIYEMHVGAFTGEGTFDAAIARLDYLAELGVTAIEVMPIAEFPGQRNWGYDGVGLFAPASAYGGPLGFKRLVREAHARGLGVLLDVVYNHLGPDGNYLPAITAGRISSDRHATPWGSAINYDGPDCVAVRDFVLQNALYWAHEYHVDGLRLDAVHAIVDDSASHIVAEIGSALHALTPRRIVIAEDERNDRRLIAGAAEGGFALDGVWADDLHHELRRLTVGDHEGYFAAYEGTVGEVADILRKGSLRDGASPGQSGTSARGLSPTAFVHCIQNHDQVGNRALGERLHHQIDPPVYRALSALLLVSPYTPLLWMGQEWGAWTPFLYFTDHPAEVGHAVTEGRREEFKRFTAFADPATRDRIPDPQALDTFMRSKLDWIEVTQEPHRGVHALYRALLRSRRDEPACRSQRRGDFRVDPVGETGIAMRRWDAAGNTLVLVAALNGPVRTELPGHASWTLVLASEETRFGGDGRWGALDGEELRLERGAVVVRSAQPGI